ncbi:MAG: NAD(P)/FAD-dependent oxidoreductase [candidate division Zixibacteria bacterium]|nr:NAD(P)/FAD-dependent oxidoreductase [candidate division Zixibacteria bacterium]
MDRRGTPPERRKLEYRKVSDSPHLGTYPTYNYNAWRLSKVDIKDVVIIGAGPAGIATAIQLKRYNIEPVLLEQEEIGGLLRNANLVENYPGFPEGIGGLDLVGLFKKQLENAGVTVTFERVLEIDYKDKVFFTKTNRKVFTSATIVIATGTKPKKFSDLPISDDIKDRIFYEIYPIRGIKNKRIAIIGAGDAAFDYALNLSFKNEVIILNKSKRTKCIPVLRERCMKSENISYLPDVSLREINNEHSKVILTCIHNGSQEKMQIDTDYLIFAMGRVPCLNILGGELKRSYETLRKANKLYMVGDVKNGIYRQTAICVGDGLKAAMEIFRNMGRDSI